MVPVKKTYIFTIIDVALNQSHIQIQICTCIQKYKYYYYITENKHITLNELSHSSQLK